MDGKTKVEHILLFVLLLIVNLILYIGSIFTKSFIMGVISIIVLFISAVVVQSILLEYKKVVK